MALDDFGKNLTAEFVFFVNQYHCIYLVTHCDENPCKNGGTCVPEFNSYSCVCHAGYTGMHCENGELLSTILTELCSNARRTRESNN